MYLYFVAKIIQKYQWRKLRGRRNSITSNFSLETVVTCLSLISFIEYKSHIFRQNNKKPFKSRILYSIYMFLETQRHKYLNLWANNYKMVNFHVGLKICLLTTPLLPVLLLSYFILIHINETLCVGRVSYWSKTYLSGMRKF